MTQKLFWQCRSTLPVPGQRQNVSDLCLNTVKQEWVNILMWVIAAVDRDHTFMK